MSSHREHKERDSHRDRDRDSHSHRDRDRDRGGGESKTDRESHREHSNRDGTHARDNTHRERDTHRDSHRDRDHGHSHRTRDSHRESRRRHHGHSGTSDGSGSRRGEGRTISRVTDEGVTVTINADHVLGNGSFGVVFEATIQETGQVVAIKKVLQDKRFKNRELQIMKQLDHPNVCKLMHCFYSTGDKPDELYLNLVLEYVPETVHKVTKHYLHMKQLPPLICVKLYVYQLYRSLAYTHAIGICHRDIKPQNLLVDPATHTLKLCDFGSAKQLVKGEPNVSYICSRYYRAPELIFGATNYTTAIDVWSAGCVLAELLVGQPMFPGDSGVDQLVEIIKVLGTPTREEIRAMNPSYTEFKFPQIRAHPWNKVIRRAPPAATDLLSRVMVYTPTDRLTPLQACAHPFFDELRKPSTRLPNGKPLPPLFNFSELELSSNVELAHVLIPEHARTASNWPPPGLRPAAATSSIPAVASPPPLSSVRGSRSARGLDASTGSGGAAMAGAGSSNGSSRFAPVSMPAVSARSGSSKLMPVPAPSRHVSSRSVVGSGSVAMPPAAQAQPLLPRGGSERAGWSGQQFGSDDTVGSGRGRERSGRHKQKSSRTLTDLPEGARGGGLDPLAPISYDG